MVMPVINAEAQFVDAAGVPYAAGTLATYQVGTLAPVTTWKDPGGSVANTQPIVLDAAGRCQIWFDGALRTILKDALGNTIWDLPTTSSGLSLTALGVSAAMLPVVEAATTPIALGLMNYLSPLSGAVARTVPSKLGDIVSVLDFGADPSGVADSTAAFNAALAAALAVYIPAGTYLIATTVTVNRDKASLVGAGQRSTFLTSTSTTAPVIAVGTEAHVTLRDFTVTRTAIATAGANGISFTGTSVLEALLEDITCQHHWNGFLLGNTAFSIVNRCTAEKNLADGFLISNGTFGPTMQWTLDSCLAQFNDGWGYNVESVVPGSGSLPAYCTLDTWIYCTTFANTAGGIRLGGQANAEIADFTLIGGWLGSDNGDLLQSDSKGFSHRVIDTVFELAGAYSGTGSAQATAAGNVGNGINYTANNNDLTVSGCLIRGNSQHGILTAAYRNQVAGTRIELNGQAAANTYDGINLVTPGFLTAVGCSIGNTPAGGQQRNGITTYSGPALSAVGNDLTLNSNKPVVATANLSAGNYYGNIGFISENSGVTAVNAGVTTQNIAHGLTGTPVVILVAPGGVFPAAWWADTPGATNFVMNFSPATAAPTLVYWTAKLSAFS